jgi:hypothetical protein
MAVDKLVDSTQLDADLTSVANAIRAKGGTSAQLAFPAGFVSAVEAIPTGGGGGGAATSETVIDTIEISQGVRDTVVTFKSDWKSDYAYIRFVVNITISATDWLYISINTANEGAGITVGYTPKKTSVSFSVYATNTPNGLVLTATSGMNTYWPKLSANVNTLHFWNYASANTHTGSITIYGGR